MNGNRPRLIHPSSNRNAAFTNCSAHGVHPASIKERAFVSVTLIAPRRHIVPCVRSRGCAAKGRSRVLSFVERKSRGYVISLWVYQTPVATNGCVCPLYKTPEKLKYIHVYDVFISSRKRIFREKAIEPCSFQP